jgi:hypothetical protein
MIPARGSAPQAHQPLAEIPALGTDNQGAIQSLNNFQQQTYDLDSCQITFVLTL